MEYRLNLERNHTWNYADAPPTMASPSDSLQLNVDNLSDWRPTPPAKQQAALSKHFGALLRMDPKVSLSLVFLTEPTPDFIFYSDHHS